MLGRAGLAFESVGSGEARSGGDEVGDGEHDVEDCRADLLVAVLG